MTVTDENQPHLIDIEWGLADRIHKVRRLFEMDGIEFGDLFGVTDKAVSTWETGRHRPRDLVRFAQEIQVLAAERGFNVPWTWMVSGEELTLRTDLALTMYDVGPWQPSFDDEIDLREHEPASLAAVS